MALAFRFCAHDAPQKNKSAFTKSMERKAEIAALRAAFPTAKTPEEQPIIPAPEIFKALDNPPKEPGALPTTAECAVHLELLEAFLVLKQKVLTSNALDRAFSISPKDKLVTKGRIRTREPDATFKTRRLVKWPIYTRLAAARFLRWWDSVNMTLSAGRDALRDISIGTEITQTPLPPLDVLMIWHAFLLNPAKYKAFCQDRGRPELYSLNLPWALIHRALTDDHRSFNLGPNATALFDIYVGEVDLFQSLADHEAHSEALHLALQTIVLSSGETPLGLGFPGLRGNPYTNEQWKLVNELAKAVERQAFFVEKMSDSLWLRSPALEGTLKRALIRYERFMQLFKEHPGTMLVPTLDIDLVWHTHQCSPKSYQSFSAKVAGRSINHDDSLDKTTRKDGFRETCMFYETRFNDEYNTCLCWKCETWRSELEKCDLSTKVNFDVIAKKVEDEVKYHKAVELARRSGKTLPIRQMRR